MSKKTSIVLVGVLVLSLLLFGCTQQPQYPAGLDEKRAEFQRIYEQKRAQGFDLSAVDAIKQQAIDANKRKDYARENELLEEGLRLLKALGTPKATATTTAITPAATSSPVSSPSASASPSPSASAGAEANNHFGLRVFVSCGDQQCNRPQKRFDLIKSLGAGYAQINFRWEDIEPTRGRFDFSKIDADVAEIEANGLIPYPHLRTTYKRGDENPWHVVPAASSSDYDPSRSYVPRDLSETWDSQYGYSETFYKFVFETVKHYKGRINHLQILEELNNRVFWSGTKEEYMRVHKTAYKAAKDADSSIIVTNAGDTAGAFMASIIKEKYDSGASLEEINAVFEEFGFEEPKSSLDEVGNWLAEPLMAEQYEKETYFIDNYKGYLDVFNFGFKDSNGKYEALKTATDWIKARMQKNGYLLPLMNYEYGNQMTGTIDEDAYARDIFKLHVFGLANGLKIIIYYGLFDDEIHRWRSFTAQGIMKNPDTPRLATTAYKTLVQAIGGKYDFAKDEDEGAVQRYVFKNVETGDCDLEAGWNDEGEQKATITPPQGTSSAEIIDYLGNKKTVELSGGNAEIDFSPAPLLVKWNGARGC